MFNKQLKKYRKLAKYTQSELAICVSQITGSKIEGDNIRSYEANTNPKLEVIEALALILKIPVQYLFDDSESALNRLPNGYSAENIIRVPLLNGHAAVKNKATSHIYIDVNSINKDYRDKGVRALRVQGDSMKPYADDSDIVLFLAVDNESSGMVDGKYIIESMNGIAVKNLSFKTNGNITISSCNPAYPSEEIEKSRVDEYLDIVGVVVGRILKG